MAFSGTNEAGATVTISVDGGAAVAATVTGTTWTVTVNGLGQGAHGVTATATDPAGNSATTASTAFSIDTIAPAVAVTAPAGGSTLNAVAAPGGNVTFSGTNELGATVGISVDGGGAVPATVTGTTWTVTVNGLGQGAHGVTATATDPAGNSATTSVDDLLPRHDRPGGGRDGTVRWLDAQRGRCPGRERGLQRHQRGRRDGDDLRRRRRGGRGDGDRDDLDGDGQRAGPGRSRCDGDGDPAGNSATTASTTFSLDTIAPAVAVTAPSGGSTLNAVTAPSGDVTFTGTTRPARGERHRRGGGAAVSATVTGTTWT